MKRLLRGVVAASVLALAIAPNAFAHGGIEVGEYLLEIGWKVEPAFVGQPNAVQVTIRNHDDESPVLDLGPTGLSVVISTAGQDSPSLPLLASFDRVERTGPLGEYQAPIVPTAPGDYTFHITGSITTQDVDVSMESSPETFDPVEGSSDLEFPVKLPNLGEVATRLDRIDARIEALASADPGSEALTVAREAADAARDASDAATRAVAAANQALLVGGLIGGLGLIIALVALVLVRRAGRGAGTA